MHAGLQPLVVKARNCYAVSCEGISGYFLGAVVAYQPENSRSRRRILISPPSAKVKFAKRFESARFVHNEVKTGIASSGAVLLLAANFDALLLAKSAKRFEGLFRNIDCDKHG